VLPTGGRSATQPTTTCTISISLDRQNPRSAASNRLSELPSPWRSWVRRQSELHRASSRLLWLAPTAGNKAHDTVYLVRYRFIAGAATIRTRDAGAIGAAGNMDILPLFDCRAQLQAAVRVQWPSQLASQPAGAVGCAIAGDEVDREPSTIPRACCR
jgi:hypothetical protein